MKISFIIVEYHSINDILSCCRSIQNCLRDIKYECEVVVSSNSVYNAAKCEELEKNYPNLQWLFNEKNGGFAYAMNKGLLKATGDVLVVLNPDVKLISGMDKMTDYLLENIGIGLIAPMVKNETGEVQDSYRQFITPIRFVSRHLKRLIGNNQVVQYHQSQSVDWVCGAFMMMTRRAYQLTNGLDEGYFLYCEDMDLCKRIHEHDLDVVYYPEAVIEYEGTRSARRSLKYTKIFLKSLFRYWRKFGILS